MNKVKKISATQLSMFDECQRKWWAHYVLKIEKPPAGPAAQLGTAHHKIMELTLRARALNHKKWSDPINYTQIASKHYKLDRLSKARLDLMSENAERCGWYDGAKLGAKSEHCIDYKIGDVWITARIDQVWIRNNRILVRDLKTSKYPYDQEKLLDNWQTRLYAFPFLSYPVTIEFLFTSFFKKIVSCDLEPKDRGWIIDETLDRINKMKNCDGSSYNQSISCKWCPFKEQCDKMNCNNNSVVLLP